MAKSRPRLDPDRPSTGSEYADVLRGVLDRAAEIEAAAGDVRREDKSLASSPPVVLLLFVIFSGVMSYNLRAVDRRVGPPQTPAVHVATAQVSLMVVSQAVSKFEAENGRPPTSLEEVGISGDEFDYRVREDGTYELGARSGQARSGYDSRRGPESLLRELGGIR